MVDITQSLGQPCGLGTQAERIDYLVARSAIQNALLSTVVQPPQCLVYINSMLSADVQTFADHMPTPIKPSSMHVVQTCESAGRVGFPPRLSIVLVSSGELGGVRFDVQRKGGNENEETIRWNIQRSLAASQLFSDIHELWMGAVCFWLLRRPYSVLWSLSSLRYLQIICGDVDEWISEGTFEALSDAAGGLVCPELDTLHVIVLHEQRTEQAQPVIERLRAVLERRTGLGYPLKRLYLSMRMRETSSSLVPETRREFGTLVEHFAWHAREGEWWNAMYSDCWRDWEKRLPPGCLKRDELEGYWPEWEQHRPLP
ncbi:hypothetical protein VTO73DRAFT_10845 [Trametes versicolor]